MVTVAEPCKGSPFVGGAEESSAPKPGFETGAAALVAVTTTVVLVATLGAVNSPVFEIVPALADQVTAVFGVPLIFAVNCRRSSDTRLALPGVSDIAVEELELEEEEEEFALCMAGPHPVLRPTNESKSDRARILEISVLPTQQLVATSKRRASIMRNHPRERNWGTVV